MAIHFTHKRLLVGSRQRDWSDVWYEPIGDPDDDGGAEFGLYVRTAGRAERREPMTGEVRWYPAFDIANCESKSKHERQRMQQQFLHDAYVYLAEQDPQKVRGYEEELDQPDFARWNQWFRHAKKYKKKQMRERRARRKRRERTAMEAGIPQEELGDQVRSDTSEDSSYETDEEMPQKGQRKSKSTSSDMPPPTSRGKRREDEADHCAGPKKQKTSAGSNSRAATLRTSGALGVESRDDPFGLGGNLTIDDNESNFSDSDEDMDTRDPNAEQDTPPYALKTFWDFKNLTPATEPKIRGRSIGTESLHDYSPSNIVARPGFGRFQGTVEEDRDTDVEPRAHSYEREQSSLFVDEGAAFDEAVRRSQEPTAAKLTEDGDEL